MSGVLRADNLSVWFGEFQALDRVSFEVDESTFLTLLGPSGCGKTTTLRIVGGFLAPDEGKVLLGGKDITEMPPYQRDINTVFQDYALFPHMTIFQNVAFGLRAKHLPHREVRARVTEALELIKLAHYHDRTIQGLSGGEQQRVALARAFVNRPTVLLLDEPLGALDLKLRREMQVELKSLQKALGIAFVYVTHDQEEALSMSDSVIIMNQGHIEQEGAPLAIYNDPSTAFVANFLGEANILPGRFSGFVDSDPTCARVSVAGREVLCTGVAAGDLRAGQDLLLSIRPENMLLGPSADRAANRFDARVENAIFVGSFWEYTLSLGDGLVVKIKELAGRRYRRYAEGETLDVGWDPGDAVLVS